MLWSLPKIRATNSGTVLLKEWKVYEPYFLLNTIGCKRNEEPQADWSEFERERESLLVRSTIFRRAVEEGEPLDSNGWSRKQGSDQPDLVRDHKRKLQLNSDRSWGNDLKVCFNILATRVHLGVADSYKFSSLLVSEGYANLTSFTSVRNKDKTKSYQIHLCFLPDPAVCEALAMGLMKPKWRIEKDKFSLTACLP